MKGNMNTCAWKSRSSMAAVAKTGLKALIFAFALLMLSAAAFAASPSATSLSGSYVFNFSQTQQAYWSKSITCTYKGNTNTYTAANWSAYTQLTYGTMTFNGKGQATVTMTQVHTFDQEASNASIVIKCGTKGGYTSNGGQLVYDAPASGTMTGAYTVASDGAGSITIGSGADAGALDFDIAGYEGASTGIASTLLLRTPESENSQGMGTAVRK
jgi:hypothetical protein